MKKPRLTRETVTDVLGFARHSLKILQTLDRDSITRARSFVKTPLTRLADRRLRKRRHQQRPGDEKILTHLKKLNLATLADFESLRAQVLRLEEETLGGDAGGTERRRTLPLG